MKEKTLFERLEEYSKEDILPMHMPGHKRAAGGELRSLDKLDITEIPGFDDLHRPDGVIKNAEERAAALWGAGRSHILVNGSTCGILAGIYSLTKPGDRVLIARNCHRSVYSAIELRGLYADYITPGGIPGASFCGEVSVNDIERAIDGSSPRPALVVITSPTYEGVISDAAGIAKVCHSRGIPLLVDEAHGAHLDLIDGFPGGAVKAGADIVIQSLHKTLSSLTQTAIAHLKPEYDGRFCRALDIFETSSPSYLLIASANECISRLSEENVAISRRMREAVFSARERLRTLSKLSLFERGNYDGSKFVILTGRTDITGLTLASLLREKYRIEVEAAFPDHIIAMSGEGDTKESLSRFADALIDIDKTLGEIDGPPPLPPLSLPETVMNVSKAATGDFENVPLEAADGRISAGYILPYPPGVPLIVPGERFDKKVIESARFYESLLGIDLDSGVKVLK